MLLALWRRRDHEQIEDLVRTWHLAHFLITGLDVARTHIDHGIGVKLNLGEYRAEIPAADLLALDPVID